MNFKKAAIVYRKEIAEMLRDRRTLFTTIVLPVIMYPLLFIGFSAIMSRQTSVIEKRGATAVYQDSISIRNESTLAVRDKILQDIDAIEYLTLMPSPPDAQKLYADKDIQAIVTLSDSLTASGLSTYKIKVQYDASGERGQMIFSKIKNAALDTEKQVIRAKLSTQKVDPQIVNLFRVETMDTSTSQKKMGMFLGMFLPYIMILTLVTGASTVAADLVAGEKERHTLETLLVSSASRSEIVLGKYLTIITMAMINVVINLVSLSFSVRYLLAQTRMETSGVQMPISAFLILLVAMLPLATLFAAVLLSISTFSRNMKEARTYEQPIMMVSMMLGMVSFIPSIDINNLLALIPVVNISLLFKAVMINEYQLSHLLLTIGSTLLLDVFAIWLTVKLFATESVLFRTEDDASLKSMSKSGRNLFSPYNGMVYYALALVALYYLGTSMQAKDLLSGLLKTQVLIILLPVFAVLRLFKRKPNEVLRLKLPKLKEVLIVPFIAVSAAILVSLISQVINSIFPFPPEYLENLSKLFKLDAPLWQMLLIIAVAPGICEEILFRGFMIRFYERYGVTVAIIASALLFAIFHLDPFRFLPVLLLGILLGYLTLRSGSIVNSMLSHAVNNSLALLMVTFAESAWLKPFVSGKEDLQYWLALPAALVLALSLAVFHRITAKKEIEN